MKITFRPHHFLCTLGFQGRGYDDKFVDNYQNIKDGLTDDTLIHIVGHTDSICAPCPHKRDLLCATQTKIEALDTRHAEALNLISGETLSWGDAKNRMKKLDIEKFHEICTGCGWKALGVCEKALNNLKNQD
jgi:hypothetical protein